MYPWPLLVPELLCVLYFHPKIDMMPCFTFFFRQAWTVSCCYHHHHHQTTTATKAPLAAKSKADFTAGHKFFNEKLNPQQRAAVLRILHGQSRPCSPWTVAMFLHGRFPIFPSWYIMERDFLQSFFLCLIFTLIDGRLRLWLDKGLLESCFILHHFCRWYSFLYFLQI